MFFIALFSLRINSYILLYINTYIFFYVYKTIKVCILCVPDLYSIII